MYNDTVEANAKNIAIILERVKTISERCTELAGNYKELEKSYGVLNECHHSLEERMGRLEAEWGFSKALIKWVLGGSMLSLALNIIMLAKQFGLM